MKLTRDGREQHDWANLTLDELQNAAAVYIEAWTVHTVDLDASWEHDYRGYIKEWLQNGHYSEDVAYSCEGLLAEFCDYHGIENRQVLAAQGMEGVR